MIDDEIHSFFGKLRQEPFRWPKNLQEREARAEAELHWRLMLRSVDDMESKIIEKYDAGTIDLIDEVIAIIRRRSESLAERAFKIARMLQRRNA
jgi:hypothetical protein